MVFTWTITYSTQSIKCVYLSFTLATLIVAMTTSTSEITTTVSTVIAALASTNSINTMTSSSTPPIDAAREQNDDSGSGVGGIVAGCVVAFILTIAIIVCLIVFLIWYRAKKKGEYTTKSGILTCDHMHIIIIIASYCHAE